MWRFPIGTGPAGTRSVRAAYHPPVRCDRSGLAMLTIHHLGFSQSERIIWLLEELDLSYRIIRYDRDAATGLAPASYKALSDFGTAPILDDGVLRLSESGAIIEYIVATHGSGHLVLKSRDPGYANYLFWWHFANGSMMPAAMMDLVARRLSGEKDAVVQALQERVGRAYEAVERRLGDASFFAGNVFTAADIMMLFPLTTMRRFRQQDLSGNPNISAYLKRIGERPAYQRAMHLAEPETAPLLS